jgi:hypothetical protein
MSAFDAVADLRIGHVVEVAGSTVRIELDVELAELTRSYGGRVYPIGQIGSVIKIHFGRRIIFGFVTLLRMRSEEIGAQSLPGVPLDPDQRVMEAELFAEGLWSSGKGRLSFTRGVTTYPLPRQAVFLLTREEAGLLYGAAEQQRSSDVNPLVQFASYVGADGAVCRANIDKMFGLHCAIVGSTGSGKSGAVAAILRGVLEHQVSAGKQCKPRIVIIDPHGEYGAAFGSRATVYRAYDPIGTDETAGLPIRLPYWLMSAEEFRILVSGKTEFEATSQHNIIYKALTHARMVAAGLVEKAPSSYGIKVLPGSRDLDEPHPIPGIGPDRLPGFDRDRPRPFSLEEFSNHIEYAQAAKVKANVTERMSETEFSKGFRSILDKLTVLRRDPRIKFLMSDWQEKEDVALSSVIGQLIGHDEKSREDLKIIDISGLPNEVAGPLAASIARILFQYKLFESQEERKRDPILLVCEEAHRYVPDRGDAEYAAAQVAIKRIAREGRKYGIGLMLVSQRPADIEATVISQCGTWVVLRLGNAADQSHVARFLPDGMSGLVKALPGLVRQEAIFVGEAAALPARIRIMDLPKDSRPRSSDIPFAAGWSGPCLSLDEIEQVAARMAGNDLHDPGSAATALSEAG